MTVNEELRDLILVHSHGFAKYEAAERDRLIETLDRASEEILGKIGKTGGDWTRAWLNRMLAFVDSTYTAATGEAKAGLEERLRELADREAAWYADALKDTIPLDVTVDAPGVAQVWKAITTMPADRGHLMTELVDKWGDNASDRMTAAIRQGVVEGETVGQMVQRIRGTRANGFADGWLRLV